MMEQTLSLIVDKAIIVVWNNCILGLLGLSFFLFLLQELLEYVAGCKAKRVDLILEEGKDICTECTIWVALVVHLGRFNTRDFQGLLLG